MTNKIFAKVMTGVVVASAMIPAMTSCKEDYLETAPITSISKADVANTLDGALYAMQGACSSMYRQMRDYNWNNTDGEPYYNTMYGEGLGNEFHDRIWCIYASNIADWTQMRLQTSMMANYQWRFSYGVISAANQVLEGIDNVPVAEDTEIAERDFIKAVCLTLRAHHYNKLFQVYGPRWVDSNNGAVTSALPLRLNSTENDVPFATSAEIMNQIYADCDQAIALFNGSSYNDNLIWTPDVNVAHGVKAHAAAVKQDWQTARSEAKAAREGHPIMSAYDYVKGGFIKANDEYLWATWFQSEGMYYDGNGGTYACNGWVVGSWGCSSGIDFDLYRNIPMTDCRKGLYLAPGFFEYHKDDEVGAIATELGLNDNSFFDPAIITPSNTNMSAGTSDAMNNFIDQYACMPEYWPDWNDPDMPLTSDYVGGPYPYYGKYTWRQSGLQYKFWGVDTFATNQYPFMRASELGYLEAEAAYMLGDEANARSIMIELNKDVRDPEFACTESGEDLLNKIRTYRHIELWGEGYNWFDYKRWNITMHRSGWVANDPTSGNYQVNLAKDFEPSIKEGWRVSVPSGEFNYNKAVSVEQLPGNNQ